jgi:hypothetical protein
MPTFKEFGKKVKPFLALIPMFGEKTNALLGYIDQRMAIETRSMAGKYTILIPTAETTFQTLFPFIGRIILQPLTKDN